jgi:PAS domain S-box-containing protein
LEGFEAEKEKKLLWRMIDSSYDGIFLTDGEGGILYCNDAFLKISGLQWDAIKGKKLGDLIAAGEIPDACSPDVIRTHKPTTKVIDYPRGVSALVTSIPVFGEDGRLQRVFSNVRNIAELIGIREQLKAGTDLDDEYRRLLWQAERPGHDNNFIVVSPVMERIFRLALRVAQVSSPVLIQGESGVGKDVLARFIHDNGEAAEKRPFVQINCSAIPETLLESELFGYEAGAFTGASKKGKTGLIEVANNGTLFLDEIGEMPLPLQVKLLDVLQTNRMYRLGGTKTVETKVRIIAATNTDLEKMIAEGRFRRDLYYRLNVIPIHIPALRERREDLVPLILHFLAQNNRKYNMKRKISPQVIDILTNYGWPGNVRELRNIIEHMVVLAEGDVIDENCVPTNIVRGADKQLLIETPDYFPSFNLRVINDVVEKAVIGKALAAFGSMRNTAAHLGIDLSTLVRKKRKYNL